METIEQRVITTEFTEEDSRIENSLRPRLLGEYIGRMYLEMKNRPIFIAKEEGDNSN